MATVMGTGAAMAMKIARATTKATAMRMARARAKATVMAIVMAMAAEKVKPWWHQQTTGGAS
jgi:hypothetical protein